MLFHKKNSYHKKLKKQDAYTSCFLVKPATCCFAALLRTLCVLRCPVLYGLLRKPKNSCCLCNSYFNKTGNVLFSQAASRQVSSALGSLTSVFEMGTGGSSPPLSPDPIQLPLNQNRDKYL